MVKTKVQSGKLNPEWNQTFEMDALEGDEVINWGFHYYIVFFMK